MRKPSNLISCAQLSPAGTLVTSLHSSGSIHCGGGASSAITSFAATRIVRFTLRMMPTPSDRRFNLVHGTTSISGLQEHGDAPAELVYFAFAVRDHPVAVATLRKGVG